MYVHVHTCMCSGIFHSTAAPGLLLIVNPSRIEYVPLTESSLQMPSAILEDRTTLIDSISGTISGKCASLCKQKCLFPACFSTW